MDLWMLICFQKKTAGSGEIRTLRSLPEGSTPGNKGEGSKKVPRPYIFLQRWTP
jgi:hypothetical protein